MLIDGARQIGKTYLIREFLKENAESYIEFNLYENDLAKKAFETINNAKELLIKISALSPKPLWHYIMTKMAKFALSNRNLFIVNIS